MSPRYNPPPTWPGKGQGDARKGFFSNLLKDRPYHGAYMVTEYASLVFAYMGPPDKIPELPAFDLFEQPDYTLVVYYTSPLPPEQVPVDPLGVLDLVPSRGAP